MKIAFTSSGSDLDSRMDARFGRAACFIILDTETGGTESIDNSQNADAAQGAGIQAAKTVAGSGASRLVTGHVGPNAFRALSAAGIEVYTTSAATVREALAALDEGRLSRAGSADVGGHGGGHS